MINPAAIAVLLGGIALIALALERLFAMSADAETRRRRLAEIAQREAARQAKRMRKYAEPYRHPSRSLWQEVEP